MTLAGPKSNVPPRERRKMCRNRLESRAKPGSTYDGVVTFTLAVAFTIPALAVRARLGCAEMASA
jgi:hypothetical protein